MKFWPITFLVSLLFSCGDEPSNNHQPTHQSPSEDTGFVDKPVENTIADKAVTSTAKTFPYQLDQPSATYSLPNKLTEISGLSLSSDGQYLLAVNDEQGKVFYLNKNTGEVVKEEEFGGPGDYEGIEAIGDMIYVVKSNGDIEAIKKPGGEGPETYKTDLKPANDVEGLGYDAEKNYLLLACKGKAGNGDEFKHQRAVYAFDLNKAELLQAPLYLIGRDEIKKWATGDGKSTVEKLAEFFDPGQADDAFAPSAIAVHPLTKEVYLLSSVGKLLVVLGTDGKILQIAALDPALHKQPEGLCFDTDGTLFISNEGKGGKGKVYRFAP
jgi:uncharacterized protein YjiK